MPTLKQDGKGNYFLDTGGGVLRPLNEQQAQAVFDNPGAANNLGAAVGQTAENLVSGTASLLSDNPYFLEKAKQGGAISEALTQQGGLPAAIGQAVPQIGVAAATAGAGLPAMAVGEGLLGAVTTPEQPMLGAVLGAGLGAAGDLAPGAVGWLANQAKRVPLPFGWGKAADPLAEIPVNPGGMRGGERPGLAPEPEPMAPPAPSANPPDFSAPPGAPPPPPNPAPRMSERVTDTLRQADAATGQTVAGTRMMEGTLTPAELYARGIPTSPGQRALLTVGAGDDAAGQAARELMGREAAQASQPFGGQQIRNVHDAQQQAATNYLTRELNLPQGINLTDPMLADIQTQLGHGFDDMAAMMGNVPITPELKSEFADILAQSRLGHKDSIQRIVDQVDQFAEQNGGNLSGEHWQEVRTQINKIIKAGTRQGDLGKLSDAGELMDTLTKAMEGGLPDAARAELQKMRHQYSITMNLFKAGSRNADGQVNPLSFYNKWNQGRSSKTRGTDEVGRFMNTMVTLTQKRMPDSGTAGRLLEAAGQLPVVGGIARGIQTARGL